MIEEIAKASIGDEIAFNQILQKYKYMLNRICRQYFLIGADYDDLMQEAMIALISAIKSYDYEKNDNFKRYAYIVINRRLLSIIRANSTEKFFTINNCIAIDNEGALINSISEKSGNIVAITTSDFENDFIEYENMKDINNKLKSILAIEDYQILKMYLDGYKYAEIAQSTNTTTKYIDNRLQSIKRKLLKNDKEIF